MYMTDNLFSLLQSFVAEAVLAQIQLDTVTTHEQLSGLRVKSTHLPC